MLKYSILIVAFLCAIQINYAQETSFEKQAQIIAKRIDSITNTEKLQLKSKIKKIDKQLEKNKITEEEAKAKKQEFASYHAQKINEGVAKQEQLMQTLIKNKVNGNLEPDLIEDNNRYKLFKSFSDENYIKDSLTGARIEKRFTTQIVAALGANFPSENGYKNHPIGDGEVGFSFKYRLKETSTLWNLKFGMSVLVKEYKPEQDNFIFVKQNGQTLLQDSGLDLKDAKLTSGYFTLPVHLELDFSKPEYDKDTNQTVLRSQRGFRLGIGGYVGFRYFTQQQIRYNDNGKKVTITERDNFNQNNFVYGPSAYIGYRDVSIYARYDAQSLFKNNTNNLNSLALGLRIDLN